MNANLQINSNELSEKALISLNMSAKIVDEYNSLLLNPVHLSIALCEVEDSKTREILEGLNVDFEEFVAKLRTLANSLPKFVSGKRMRNEATQDFVKVFETARNEKNRLGDGRIGEEHLLLALIQSADPNLKTIFNQYGITPEKFYRSRKRVMGNDSTNRSKNSKKRYKTLEKFGVNLTKQFLEGGIDPIIGRDVEIRRVIQVISRRSKNNPVLIGEPGVGKTAVVEGFVSRIAKGEVPENLQNKVVFTLDIGLLMAGAKYRGDFEERLKSLIQEVKDSQGEVVVFIDEIHTVVGAGRMEGAMDAANLLKPALARGELRCIGATTINEYRKYIEKDAALERRFQPVLVAEPSLEDTISILNGVKDNYEKYHGVRIRESAIVAAAKLSKRYISDRFLPDKAIDLLDEAAAKRRVEMNSKPLDLELDQKRKLQLEIELKARESEHDFDSEKTKEIEKQLNDLKSEVDKKTAQWESEKKLLNEFLKVKRKVDEKFEQIKEAEANIELDSAARLKYGELPPLQAELEKLSAQLPKSNNTIIRDQVEGDDIAEIVASWTGIPVTRLLTNEKENLLKLPEQLHKRVVGQDKAIDAIANTLRRARIGLSGSDKPLGSFLFVGPTGVGKTEVSKALAKQLFGAENSLIRIDMSEYQERYSISRLIGSPPGYIGYDDPGQLTETVRRRPYSVILLDEIEKAHPEVYNLLLQILDDGRLTDGQGKTVNFSNCIIIMTSNVGSDIFQKERVGFGYANEGEKAEDIQVKIGSSIKSTFRPEFINRIDEIVMFHALDKEHISQVVDIQIKLLNERISEHRIVIKLDSEAKKWLVQNGHDVFYGARPLKRLIRKQIEDKLAMLIIEDKTVAGEIITVDVVDNELVLMQSAANFAQ